MGDILEIHYFDRSKGQKKKCRTPFKKEPLKLEEVENLERNFCRKDTKTGVQKQIRCLACKCQVESSDALKSHLKGNRKSQINFENRKRNFEFSKALFLPPKAETQFWLV